MLSDTTSVSMDAPAVEDVVVLTPEQEAARVAAVAEESQAASAAAHLGRNHYQLRIAIEGRIRFLSHLETVDTLLSAFRRAGVTLALSQGMRPKPLIKVAMPRPVGVEALGDIVEVELENAIAPAEFAESLARVLPRGITVTSVDKLTGAYDSAASRVVGATYRMAVRGASADALRTACEQLLAEDDLLVERVSPKRVKRVNVRAVIGALSVIAEEPPTIRVHLTLTDAGSAKPEEVVRALTQVSGLELTTTRTIRESISIAGDGTDGREVEASQVGADVPDGPEKPWGAC